MLEYSFENYIHGAKNLEPYKILRNFAENPAGLFYLRGRNSTGKTHLLAAVEQRIKSTSSLNVVRISFNEFRNNLLDACKSGTSEGFYKTYANLDVLLIDDCQFLVTDWDGDLLAPILEMFQRTGRAMILAGDYLPDTLEKIKSLRVLSLSAPSYATRRQLLLSYLQHKELALNMDVVDYIARNLTNIRQLQGFAKWLYAHKE